MTTFTKSITTPDDINEDLNLRTQNTESYHDIAGEKEARNILIEAIDEERPIVNVSDYDVDGTISAKICKDGTLRLATHRGKNISYQTYIPLVETEGYGFSNTIAERLVGSYDKPGLLILTDNGITCHDSVKYMKDAGWDVLIFDHHKAQANDLGQLIFPKPDILIDPEALPESSEFHGYCGAHLMYHFFNSFDETVGVDEDFKKVLIKDMRSLAAIATRADVMDLIEYSNGKTLNDNGVLLREGLKDINSNNTIPSIRALLDNFNYKNSNGIAFYKEIPRGFKDVGLGGNKFKVSLFTEKDLDFGLNNRLNHPKRVRDTGGQEVFEFLDIDSYDDAVSVAQKIVADHAVTKEDIKAVLPLAKEFIEASHKNEQPIIVMAFLTDFNIYRLKDDAGPTFIDSDGKGTVKLSNNVELDKNGRPIIERSIRIAPGQCGLICPKLVEEYNKPAVVFTKHTTVEGTVLVGSARSIDGFDVFQLLSKEKDLYQKFGGHPAAAGLSFMDSDPNIVLSKYKKWLNNIQEDAKNATFPEKIENEYDHSLSIEEFKDSCAKIFGAAPYGKNNAPMRLYLKNVPISKVTYMGKNEDMSKLSVSPKTGINLSLVDFTPTTKQLFLDENYDEEILEREKCVDVIGVPTINYFKTFKGDEYINVQFTIDSIGASGKVIDDREQYNSSKYATTHDEEIIEL